MLTFVDFALVSASLPSYLSQTNSQISMATLRCESSSKHSWPVFLHEFMWLCVYMFMSLTKRVRAFGHGRAHLASAIDSIMSPPDDICRPISRC